MLTITDLSKTYPNGVQALQGVSLTVERGLFGLLGPNGAGKSTLMRTLATLQEPDSGEILFDGLDVVREPEAHRRHLGYLPQDFGVYPGVSAYDLLEHLAVLKGLADRAARREQVEALLEQTNLWAHRKKAVSGFSGGMRQRFGIAQALLGDPKILIVDEPTVGLDPEERVRFRNLLSELGHGRTVILSTHIVSDVEAIAERIAVIRQGRLVRFAAPEELLAHAAGRVFRAVLPAERLAEAQRRVAVSNLTRRADGVHVRFVGDGGALPGAVAVEPTLEDAYLLTNVEAA